MPTNDFLLFLNSFIDLDTGSNIDLNPKPDPNSSVVIGFVLTEGLRSCHLFSSLLL